MELRSIMNRLSKIDKYPFHMPGHKGRFPSLAGFFDPTELPGLDNLHSPHEVLDRAQNRIADIYRTKKTYFLVNGGSVGIMAGILATVKPGDLVLVQRSSHKAVVSGLIHSGAMPVWIEQDFCPQFNHWLPPTKKVIRELLASNPVRAVILTSPDYYGLAPDLGDLTAICHTANAKVVVDEAHGSHLFFGAKLGLPQSAAAAGCDIIVQSPHKTLPAVTQAAWMHLNDMQLSLGLQQSLNLLHTTSPSYVLLASLEYAGEYAQAYGLRSLKKLSVLTRLLEQKCGQHGVKVWSRKGNRDWTKLVMENRPGALELLYAKGIYPELVRDDLILFMLTVADSVDTSGIAALAALIPEIAELPLTAGKTIIVPPPAPIQECTPRDAWLKKGEQVPLKKAMGRICRQIVAPYPPGTMVVVPGQRLGKDHIEYLELLHARRVVPGWIEVI